MPLYEYVCANGHRTELMHGVHDAGPTSCPVCGATMRKAFVAPAIVFKGSGWAKVDRRSSASARKTDSSTDAAASTESTPSGADAGSKNQSGGSDTGSSSATTDAPAAKTKTPADD